MADWGDGVSASCKVYPGSRNSPFARAMHGHILRYGTISSYQSPAIFRDYTVQEAQLSHRDRACFVSLNISLSSHSRSFEITLLNRACVKVPIHCNYVQAHREGGVAGASAPGPGDPQKI